MTFTLNAPPPPPLSEPVADRAWLAKADRGLRVLRRALLFCAVAICAGAFCVVEQTHGGSLAVRERQRVGTAKLDVRDQIHPNGWVDVVQVLPDL